jgi:hypothetical protein
MIGLLLVGGLATAAAVALIMVPAMLLGAVMLGMGALGFFFFAVTGVGLAAYLDTILFRYATGQALPGIDPSHFPSAAPLQTGR